MPTSFNYDETYEPAAPVVEIGISASGANTPVVYVTALLDTGADATMIPQDILRTGDARYVEQRRMRGVSGPAVTVKMYLLAIHLGNQTIHGIRAIALPSASEIIVGRDVLNQLTITLHGPAHTTDIL